MSRRSQTSWIWWIPVGGAALLVLYPTGMLFLASIMERPPGDGGDLTLAHYWEVFSDPSLLIIAWNTLWVGVLSTIGGTIPGFFIAWLVTRTDIPMRRLTELIGVLPFLLPSSLAAIGWGILANPDIGTVNLAWRAFTGAENSLVNIYTYGGVSFVMGLHAAGFAYLMAVGPMRNVDPSFEDASRLSGASSWQTFRSVQLPMLAPALLPVVLLIFFRALESFEVPVILGSSANVYVLTNEIYRKLKILQPPQYGVAFTLACIVTVLLGSAMIAQARLSSRRSHVSITGKGYQPRLVRLGFWKVPCILFLVLYAASVVLPIGMIVINSFSGSYGFDIQALTTKNYERVLGDSAVLRALGNTLLLMIVPSTICIVLGGFVAYALQHSYVRGRDTLTMIFLIPWAMPGIVFGMAMLWAYITIPYMYGTLAVLMVAYVTLGIPIGIRASAGVLGQMSNDLEQSSRVLGANTAQTLRWIVFPLVRPGMIAGWFVLATIFSRELAASIMLYGYGSEVISVTLLGYWEQGRLNYVAVMSVVMLAVLTLLYTLQRLMKQPVIAPV